jgi:L-alanine-DL-glutamate epimerase-like enolase superfamily enzyme
VGKINADLRWAFEPNRTEATARAREAFQGRFELLVDPHGTLTAQERAKRTANLKRAYYRTLALKSGEARRSRAAGKQATP